MPIVFAIGLVAAYEGQMQRLRFFNPGQRPSAGVLVAIFVHLGLLPSNVDNFRAPYAPDRGTKRQLQRRCSPD